MKNFILTVFIAFIVFLCVALSYADSAGNAHDLFTDKSMDEMVRRHEDMAEEMLSEPVNPESNEIPPTTIDELFNQSQYDSGATKDKAVLSR